MIDHIGFPGSDYQRSKAFYERALAPLDYTLIMEVTQENGADQAAGFGAPGIRAHYHPSYNGAFVLDPDATTSKRSATRRNSSGLGPPEHHSMPAVIVLPKQKRSEP